jgi:hypothetical protein
MFANLAIDSLLAAALVVGWYFWFRTLNRRRSAQVLRWIDSVFADHGRVAQVRWINASRFAVELRLCPTIFRRASLAVQLQPREMPLQWLLSRLRKRKETVTFEAELEHRPNVSLHVQNHRWSGPPRRLRPGSWEKWKFESLGPVLISTQPKWQKEFGPLLEALLATRSCEFLHIGFRRRAPHFVACAPLQSLCPDSGKSGMFDVLHELATSASTSAQ